MRLVSVYSIPTEVAASVLWDFLAARPAEANISHKEMPTRGEHLAFIALRPYTAWLLIEEHDTYVGAVYLTKQDEIGVSLLPQWQRQGLATEAVRELCLRFPRKRYLANVAPANLPSQQFWLKQGFRPLQVTYVLAKPAR